jgi:hypothetical protein
MIMYDFMDQGGTVTVEGENSFVVDLTADHAGFFVDREGLAELREAIDRALNTSAEEMEASGETPPVLDDKWFEQADAYQGACLIRKGK